MRWQEVAARVLLIFGSALAVSEHATVWVSAPLGLLAIAATVELAVRPYARNNVDRVLIGCGTGVVGLILLGVGLNLTPSGLTRTAWAVTWIVVGVAVLNWRRRLGWNIDFRQSRIPSSALWAVPIVIVLLAAGFVAQAGARSAQQPELALSLVSTATHTVTVQIDAAAISGRYRLTARSSDPGAANYAGPAFGIDAENSRAHLVKHIPTNVPSRWIITLAALGGGETRSLTVDVGPPAGSWVTTWHATFAGPQGSRVSPSSWQYILGSGFGDGEVETMTSATQNVHVDGRGDLVITPLLQNGQWTSARLRTKQTFLFAPGGEYRVSAALIQPNPAVGTGYWPAFWLVTPGTVQHTGEIDVVEDINGGSQHSGSLHCGYLRSSKNLCQSYGVGSGLVACPGCQVSYNTYSVVIDRRIAGAEMISWYLNGKEFYSISEGTVGDAMWSDALSRPFTIVLDVSMGGGYPDSRCGCTSPLAQTTPGASMFVRYLTVARVAS